MPTKNPEETKFLAEYDASLYEKPNMAVDTAIFTIFDGKLHVLLTQRTEHPFNEQWSLVGGFVDTCNDDDLKRKLLKKTNVATPYLEQVGTIGNKSRDPRGWSVSTLYFALLPHRIVDLQKDKSRQNTKWAVVKNGLIDIDLAFDHNDLLLQSFNRLRSKVLYTDLPVNLMEESFSLGTLQKAYGIILGQKILHKSFRRRILTCGILSETGQMEASGNRPALLYKHINKTALIIFYAV